MAIGFSTNSYNASMFCLAAMIIGVGMAGVVNAAGPVGASAAALAFQKAVAELKSGDAGRVAKVEAAVKADVDAGKAGSDDVQLLEMMDGLGMAADVEAVCLEGVIQHPEALCADQLLTTRITSLLKEKKKDEALAAAKSFYDAAVLVHTADAIRMVTLCLAVDTPADQGLASRFKRQQIAWAAVPTTEPAALRAATTQASGSSGDDQGDEGRLGEPVLAGIKADASPYEAAIKAIEPINFNDFLQKGDLLLLADRPAEAKELFERASDVADSDVEHLAATEGIARTIRAESGCVGPANAYILALRGQK